MGEVTCQDCGLVWGGCGATGLLRRHACLLTRTPSVKDLLNYLEVTEDARGCLIPTAGHARPARGSGQHWMLTSAAVRILDEEYAHRAILRLKLGRPITRGMVAAHECAAPHYENPQCVRPDHLYERTRSENSLWMAPQKRSELLGGPMKGARMTAMNLARTGKPRDPGAVAKTAAALRGKPRDPSVHVKAWETRRKNVETK